MRAELMEMIAEVQTRITSWSESVKKMENRDFETWCCWVDCHGIAVKSLVSDVWRIFY